MGKFILKFLLVYFALFLSAIRESLTGHAAPVTPEGRFRVALLGQRWTDSDSSEWLTLTFIDTCYTFLFVSSPCGVYSSKGFGVQFSWLLTSQLLVAFILTGKIEEAFLLEKNVNVLLQALH